MSKSNKSTVVIGYVWPEHMLYKGDLRDAKGERGTMQGGAYFGQSEPENRFSIYDSSPRYAGIHWHFHMVELNNGCWLSSAFGCAHYDRQFPTREAALRCSVARLLRLARRRIRPVNPGPLFSRIGEAEFRAVIAWLYEILAKPAPTIRINAPLIFTTKEILPTNCEPQLNLFAAFD
jgi:hypothetical protein